MRKHSRLQKLGGIFLGGLVFGLVLALTAPVSAQQKPFVFSLGWVPYGRDLGWYTAEAKGFFKQEGLNNVRIVRGFGGGDTMKKIGAGSYTMGAGTTPIAMVIAYRSGIKSKMLMTQHDIAPMVLWTLKDRGVNSLRDLMGKSLGAPANDAIWPNIKLMYKIKGYDIAKVKFINTTPAAREAGMLAGSYNVSTGFITQYPILARKAKQVGKQIHFVLLSNEGLNIYGTGLVVLDKTVKERGDELKKFLRAAVRGVAYALEHPDESIGNLFKVCPTCAKEANREVWDVTGDLWYSKGAKVKGLGAMTDEKWKATLNYLAKPLKLKSVPTPSEFYTNDYLPGIKLPKRGPRKAPRFNFKG